MKPVCVCVPVLRRYDLFRQLLLSLRFSTIRPDKIYVIDNGRDEARMNMALSASPVPFLVHRPTERMGVAESWNWFIQNVPEERVIANDDIEFASESLAQLVAADTDIVWADSVGFSCFVIRDSCIEKIGLFDETISPGYGYYEDEDYLQRLNGRGTREPSASSSNVVCGVKHEHSATLKAASHAQTLEHHRLFKIAQGNYARKWGVTFP